MLVTRSILSNSLTCRHVEFVKAQPMAPSFVQTVKSQPTVNLFSQTKKQAQAPVLS